MFVNFRTLRNLGGVWRKGTEQVIAQIDGQDSNLGNDEYALSKYLDEQGPIYIGVDGDILQSYQGGIIYGSGDYAVNHAIALVGIGLENGEYYWVGRNSWGEGWGEAGYFRFQYGVGALGITTNDGMWINAWKT
jgi:C1A family cysteine protease